MSTYKVIQDIEAEDKLVGPLTLRQFIYAGIACVCLYLSFLCITHSAAFMIVVFLPIAGFTGFFAFPFARDQPTEVWALAKVRFMFKPRKRIWDQSGTKELVSITAPKQVEQPRTNGLSKTEVESRLRALADTIDSRGWAVKNANVNMYNPVDTSLQASDRLVAPLSMPQEVTNIDVRASDDILDEANNPIARNFNSMITASQQHRRQELIAKMQAPEPPTITAPAPPQPAAPADYYFMHQPAAVPGQAIFQDAAVVTPGAPQAPYVPQAAAPTPEEEELVAKFKQENASQQIAYGHLKTVLPLSEQAKQPLPPPAPAPVKQAAPKPSVTPEEQAAIINLANRDDLDVATIQRQADEVVISLH